MRYAFFGVLGLAACLSPAVARAQPAGDWNTAFGQGYLEHVVRNGPGNSFNISCNVSGNPDTLGKPSMFVEIVGKSPAPRSFVDVFAVDDVYRFSVDQKGYISLDCRACAATFNALWDKLRKADAIVVQYGDGQNSSFKTRGGAKALTPKPCQERAEADAGQPFQAVQPYARKPD